MLGKHPQGEKPMDAHTYKYNKVHRNHKSYQEIHNAYPIIIRRVRKPKDGRDLLLPPRSQEKRG